VEPGPEFLDPLADALGRIGRGGVSEHGFGKIHEFIGSGGEIDMMQAGTVVMLCCSIN
jgi:hypothetical protein